MKYPTQESVINRLTPEALKSVDQLRDAYRFQIKHLWEKTRNSLQASIFAEYKRDFGSGSWNVAMALKKGTLHRIDQWTTRGLRIFQEDSMQIFSSGLKEIYREACLRHAWILDQVTPASYKIKLPHNRMFMTEAATIYQGPEADTAWKVRWALWLDSYRSALNQNLKLGAINNNDINQAVDEVEATRPGSPATNMENALMRVYDTQTSVIYANALEDLAQENDDIDLVQIWQTRYNTRVCDICEENKGLTADEADDDIPAHPNCECYWRLVPASWAELLQSGNADEQELAKVLDAHGLVPGSMAVMSDDGVLMGNLIVTYKKWTQENQMNIMAGV